MSRSGSVVALSAARGVAALSAIGIAAIGSRMLDKDGYATYRQTLLIFTVAAPLISLCMPSALIYFVAMKPERKRTILLENFFVTGTLVALFALFCVWPGSVLFPRLFDNPLLAYTVPFLGLYAIGQISISSLDCFLIACERAPLSAAVSASARVVAFVAVGLAAWIFRAPLAIVVAHVAVSALAGIVAIMIMLAFSRRGSTAASPTVAGGKEQLAYAFPLGLAVAIDTLSMSLDKIYVSILLPTEDYAVFVNGAMEIPLIGALAGAVGSVMLPDIAKAFSNKEDRAALDLWKLAIRRLAFVLFPLGAALYLFSSELMVALYSSSFAESAIPFRIYLLILPARAFCFHILFRAAGKSGLVIRRSIFGLIINAIITYPFVIWFGANGAAWATVASFWLFVIPFSVSLCRKVAGVGFASVLPWGFLVRLMGLCLVAGAAAMLVAGLPAGLPELVGLLLRGLVYGSVFLVGAKLFFPQDLHSFWSLSRRFRRR